MKKMKRLLACMLTLMIGLASLTACGGSPAEGGTADAASDGSYNIKIGFMSPPGQRQPMSLLRKYRSAPKERCRLRYTLPAH